ncbi:MAG: DUF4340 domain-containing protein [Candidatus Cloacimonetes bacterium]|nr:DUF4340 domain-containing protein [Candidatus Cloacimonadota bacterium]
MNKKNLMLLAGLIVLVIIFFLAKKKEHIETDFSIFGIDSLKVETIKLSTEEDTLIIIKDNGNWMINYPVKADVKPSQIQQFFKEVVFARVPINPMSENETSQEKYSVADGQGYRINLADKSGQTIADHIVGEGSNWEYSYIRKVGDNKIYQLRTNAYRICKPDLRQWRNNVFLEIDDEMIDKVHIQHGSDDYEMIRTPGEKEAVWTYKDKDEEFVVLRTNPQLRKFFGFSKAFRTQSFRDNQWDSLSKLFEKPEVVATIYLKDGTQHTVTMVKDTDNKVLLKKDDYTYTIYESSADLLSRLSFSKEQFKNEK